ncbi:hypothetical protein CTAYLR_007284 [Chrysophaeum taylorii]|uniref:SAP domain-containing protein n=1 Tax=Chrysophaeum taylorii TaxID=2483200 RepID=A0AAD7UJD9_9STRA|nr:hypothetical protein CTAYLR_007284 [Chrysophaeum taylorii]
MPMRLDEVCMVCDVDDAARVAARLLEAVETDPRRYHAVDTEVDGIDLSKEGPVGNGCVTCFSVYSGPDFDYGEGPGKTLWVETTNEQVLGEFREWFESPALKVWHNYGFDRHVVNNHRIGTKGFAGDTMHMARLDDSSRLRTRGGDGYSLEALSRDLVPGANAKIPMKELFADFFRRERARATGGADVRGLDVLKLQTNDETRGAFVAYSAYDAKSTWLVHRELRRRLEEQTWEPQAWEGSTRPFANMWEFYQQYFVPFGELLTDMEAIGIYVDSAGHLRDVETRATSDKQAALGKFHAWAQRMMGEDGKYLNPASSKQIQILLFGGSPNEKTSEVLEVEKEFDVVVDDPPPEEELVSTEPVPVSREEFYARATAVQLRDALRARGLKVSGTKTVMLETLKAHDDGGGLTTATSKKQEASPAVVATSTADPSSSLSSVLAEFNTVKKLKDELRRRGLVLSGKKAVLQERLAAAIAAAAEEIPSSSSSSSSSASCEEEEEEKAAPASLPFSKEELFGRMTYEQLCGQIRARGTPPPPTRELAVAFLLDDEAYREELQKHHPAPEEEHPPPASVLYMLREPAKKSRKRTINVRSLGFPASKYTTNGWPSVTADVLRELAGNPPEEWGTAFGQFDDADEGKEACLALDALCRMGSIDTMLQTFVGPLRLLADANSRVHCSLNLNTETGRLSSRRPNLQNQPALEKDSYLIRKAFRAMEGNSLIVADYGQLELRLLAAITKCESMLAAFRDGGCFHSRTAVGMFEHVKNAVESGEVLLEKGAPGDDRPLVKDKFGSERRKAKTLNFSIAYGKTAHGLAQDWGVSTADAQELLDAWYADRPEVRRWQQDTIKFAKKHGYATTLMGRRRYLPDIQAKQRGLVNRGARAAINTPIQGSAADVVMMAMLNLHTSKNLADLGWKLLLQIHDEVILEGPEHSAPDALAEVRRCMEYPYDHKGLMPLDVDLTVDAKTARSWYDAK